MPVNRKPDDTVESATAALEEVASTVSEASRTSAEATRRSADRQVEAAIAIARDYQNELAELNRRLVGAWGSGLEAGWGGAIEVQRAWVSAGLALVDANTRWQRLALEQWSEMTRRTVLEPLQVLGRTAERLAEDGRSARGSTR